MYFRKFTFIFSVLVTFTLIIGLTGCEKMMTMMPEEEGPADISIGMIVSQTGKDAEPYGLPMQRGFELALEEINNAHGGSFSLSFITKDDQSTEEGAIQAVEDLLDEGVSVMVGIAISDYLEDAFPIAQEAGAVAFSSVSSAAGLSSIGDYVFRTGLATNIMIPNGVMITQEKIGYTKAALIYDGEDTYSISSNDEVTKALQANGVEILTTESFMTGDTDFATQLTNIMNMEPEVLFISALAVEMTQVISQAGELGLTDSIQLIVPDLTNAEAQSAGGASEGVIAFASWFSMADTPGNQMFVQNYSAKHGFEPEPWAAQSYATLYILANAIINAQTQDALGIRDALAQTADLPTVLGNFSFDPNGEALYDPIILVVEEGTLQIFE